MHAWCVEHLVFIQIVFGIILHANHRIEFNRSIQLIFSINNVSLGTSSNQICQRKAHMSDDLAAIDDSA